MSFNRVTIVGNLGRDPELRYTPQGTAVTNLNIATTEKKRVNGEYESVTTWFRVTVWGKQAETAAKYLQKGSAVFIVGALTIEEWTDRDGNTRTTLCVNANDMQFVGGGNGNNNNNGGGDFSESENDGDGSDEFDVAAEEVDEEEKPAPRQAPAKKPAAKPAPAKTAAAKKPAAKKTSADDDDFNF